MPVFNLNNNNNKNIDKLKLKPEQILAGISIVTNSRGMSNMQQVISCHILDKIKDYSECM